MRFEYKQCSMEVTNHEFAGWQQGHGGQCRSDFWRYNVRGDWFTIAFPFDEHEDKYPPRWVTLISTGNRQIFECTRSGPELECVAKTNELMRLPADSVIDCIKTHSVSSEQEIYHMFDCWVIGSKPLYKRNFIQRQEFCRVLYQGFGSKYLKFAGAMPAVQSLQRPAIKQKANANALYLFFVRNKKSTEQQEAKNPRTAAESQYWRPTAVKLWNARNRNHCPFDKMLSTLQSMNRQQMQNKQRMKARHRQ